MSAGVTVSTFAFAALLLCYAGLGALRLGWRRKHMPGRLAILGGWALLVAAICFSIQAWGVEYGTSYALAALSLMGLSLVAVNTERRPQALEKVRSDLALPASAFQKWLTFLAAGPLAGITSMHVTLWVARALPGGEINNMAIAAIVFPVLWALTAYLVCFIRRPVLSAISLTVTAAIACIALY